MDSYEKVLDAADSAGVDVIDYRFASPNIKGLYCDGTAALSTDLKTAKEKSCILAEELGHFHTTTGDILDQTDVRNRKQEYRARVWAYNNLVGLTGIIRSYLAGCRNRYEMAEYLDVTEAFLTESLNCYRQKYGICTQIDNYVIFFEPCLGVLEVK